MDRILEKIYATLGATAFIDHLAEKLTGAEFNSFLLDIFRRRAATISPVQLLHEFGQNRFVQPAGIDPIRGRELELAWLKDAQSRGFIPLTLSPVAPLGTCSVVGAVSQHKVLSGSRGTEVVADATNVLALLLARDFKGETNKDRLIRYATVHRHVRGQYFDNPDFTAHFSVFCLASGGFDRGNFAFELDQLNEHVGLILALLKQSVSSGELLINFYLKSENKRFEELLRQDGHAWSGLACNFVPDLENKYYRTVQFKRVIKRADAEIDIADGGFVDWTQQMIANRKHRVLISGVGLELLQKLF